MTDGEKARIRDTKELFDIASTKAVPNSIEGLFYVTVSLTLGWVLDEPHYREGLQEHVNRLKSMGVEPNQSVIERPPSSN